MNARPTTGRGRRLAAAPLLALLLALGIVAAACGGDDAASSNAASSDADSSDTGSSDTAAATVTGDLTVSAAASLEGAFTTIGEEFEAAHPGTTVTINFGSSGDLATQIQGGAPADVAAFAAESDMTELSDAGLLDGSSEIFATNELVIVTEPGNPAGIEGLSDLASAGVVSLCAATAPCGRYADRVLADAGVTIPADRITRGQDVRATLTAVTQGDASAGIVYVTDARAAGDAATSVEIPADRNAVARYPIAVVGATENAGAAEAFMDFVLAPRAREVLEAAGFGAP
ncbi:molybdate ABC transporter substrate-binding protein [Dermatobacter hominis]|uniref:molybdate ABC transporter substrate-binding protein n=1 Tax=Dermatobacter hominis TaxID=2884263 RepID=UPI001D1208C8|nr:molybdate ABC transporter substrate-binding protein [Dermatobacter hominis]UDY36553.1 molybdate ABC transporter substrate-binding protein [Dermatobacter hominis]